MVTKPQKEKVEDPVFQAGETFVILGSATDEYPEPKVIMIRGGKKTFMSYTEFGNLIQNSLINKDIIQTRIEEERTRIANVRGNFFEIPVASEAIA